MRLIDRDGRREDMTTKEMITRLNQMAVITGGLNCLGCVLEHNCGIHGCVVLREVAEHLADQEAYRWREADQEKPPEGKDVLCCISGKWDHIIYDHAYAVGSYWTEDEEWEFDCVPAHESDRVTVHQWKRIEKPQRKGAKK